MENLPPEEYTKEQIEETKRFVYIFYTELELQERSVFDTLKKLADESILPQYKEFYQVAWGSVGRGDSISSVFDAHPTYKDLFMRSLLVIVREGEQQGTLVQDMLGMWKSFVATGL